MKKRKASKGPDGAKQAGPVKFPSGGITIGDYPNSKNIRAWMRLYFGWGPMNTDIRFTYWRKRGELPDINTASDVLRFGLSKGCTPTDAGRAKAFELGLLSDDSPAVLIPATQANTAGRGTAPGRKPGPSADVSHGFYGIADLATRNGIPEYRQGAFEKRLRRWRKDNALSGDVIEHDASCKNQARFLFRESAGAIQDIINLYAEKA